MNTKRSVLAGIAAGIVLNVLSFLFGLLPGKNEFYTQLFPGLVSIAGLVAMVASVFLLGIFMGIVYGVVNTSFPGGNVKKGMVYGVVVFLFAGTMWPIMMMGFAPAYIWITEIIGGFIEFIIAGIVVAAIYGKS